MVQLALKRKRSGETHPSNIDAKRRQAAPSPPVSDELHTEVSAPTPPPVTVSDELHTEVSASASPPVTVSDELHTEVSAPTPPPVTVEDELHTEVSAYTPPPVTVSDELHTEVLLPTPPPVTVEDELHTEVLSPTPVIVSACSSPEAQSPTPTPPPVIVSACSSPEAPSFQEPLEPMAPAAHQVAVDEEPFSPVHEQTFTALTPPAQAPPVTPSAQQLSQVDEESSSQRQTFPTPTPQATPLNVPEEEEAKWMYNEEIRAKLKCVIVPQYAPTQEGKRQYSKTDYCYFCEKPFVSKISKHYMQIHDDLDLVKDILMMPVRSQRRKFALQKLQNMGNFKHNCKVLEKGEGILVTVRRPADKQEADKFVPCEYCLGFFHVEYLATHGKNCHFRGCAITDNHNYLRNGRTILSPFLRANNSATETQVLLSGMRETKKNPGIVAVCEGDHLIQMFAESKCDRLGTKDEQRRRDMDNIQTKVRTVGRLLKQLNAEGSQWRDLCYFLHPSNFDNVWKAVKQLSSDCDSPQLALTLGHYIKQIILLKRSRGVQTSDEAMVKEATDFKFLYDAHWNNKVAAVHVRRQRLRHVNKEVQLPSTEDIVKLTKYVVDNISAYVSGTKPLVWTHLDQLLIVRILLFNKRRVSEVDELKKSHLPTDPKKCLGTNVNQEILDSLDVSERTLASRMYCIQVRGKSVRSLRPVFVLLTPDMKEAIDFLDRYKTHTSDYIFGSHGVHPLSGCTAIRQISDECPGLQAPETIRTRQLRKYMATTSQILNMSPEELKMLADHMGHNINIHTDVYRLQSSLLEKTKVARILLAMESGKLGKFSGQRLESISLEDLPMPEPDDVDRETTDDVQVSFVPEAEEDTEEYAPRKKTDKKVVCKWTDQENDAVRLFFEKEITNRGKVTTERIQQCKQLHICLKNRSNAVLRTKINNLILRKEKC